MDKLEEVLRRLKKYEPERIILFGSYGTEDMDEYSDLDLVVIKQTPKRFIERLIEVWELLGEDVEKVDVFVYTPEEWERMLEEKNAFAIEVIEKGRVVYEKGQAGSY
ncbi:nucleotidyltransferase domain-containing protein [bacterium]|nr:nucleotidyltransferase domain-containing protein [bacterium]